MYIPSPHQQRRGFTLIELLVVFTIIVILAALLFPVVNTMKRGGRSVSCTSQLRQYGMAVQNYANDNDGSLVLGSNMSYYWMQFLHPYITGTKPKNATDLPNIAYCPEWLFTDTVGKKQGKSNTWDVGYAMNIQPGYDPSVKGSDKHNRWYGSGNVRDTGWTQDFKLMDITYKSGRALIVDGEEFQVPKHGGFVSYDRHSAKSSDKNNPNNRANVLFFDYHVESCPPAKIKLALGDPKQLEK